MKLNSDFTTKFASLHFDPTKYVVSPSFGVNRFMIDRVGNEKARATTIVEYKPNSKFPQHTHIGGEEFLVLKGTFKDQYGIFPAGTYVRNPVGTKHAPWVDDDGCVIFVKLLQMTDTKYETSTIPDGQSLHVSYDKDDVDGKKKSNKAISCEYGKVLEMYSNPTTGEHVTMNWIDGGMDFPPSSLSISGGEELFILQGSLELEQVEKGQSAAKTETYTEWGWLRFPPSTATTETNGENGLVRRSTATSTSSDDSSNKTNAHDYKIKAGPDGAQVYRKCGHLTQEALSYEKIQIDPETEEVIVASS
eukprot:CAMPEP_0113488430 /NCGR_PEP_ID=MMETSP0014_2-20120614/26013_1 /TAXON_ID=2857 /ORGANISM="Nitzschia sp." /LENGTH=304 /DNA_ID=CAMNT_0000382143 /DNA_START=103 /DNA_END=1020 /DNA_ORIENTATION=+ /assembly_acc=CAM_ASM_000159